jgi:hypothetical protein
LREEGPDALRARIDSAGPPKGEKPKRHNGQYSELYPPIGNVDTPPQPQPIETFSAAKFEGKEPPPRRWLVKDRIPMAAVTLLVGDGAVGKTTIAMQLSVCVAALLSGWLNGFVDEHGPVLFYSAEEDEDEVHRRLHAVVQHHNISYPPSLHGFCATDLNPILFI